MATGRIRGITIELNADTKGLYKSLNEARSAANQVQKSLKDVNNLLKLKPTSTELLTQKQKLLGERVTEVGKRLEEEKRLLEALQNSADSDKTVAQQEALKRQIEATTLELQRAEKEMREFGSVGVQQVAAVGEQMKAVGQQITDFGKSWTQKVSMPLGAGLTLAAKGALDFGDSMAKVHTLSDDAVISFEDLTAGVMALSDATGRSGTELAEAMYQALSASVNTADALDFTEKAAKLAKAGFLETAGAVDVLTTILNAYRMEASETEKISDILIQTQNDGKTTVNELAQQMGQVIPTAAAYNINLENLAAAYALMTKNGINTANSTTYLNGMFTELARNGSEVSEILKEKTGKTFGELQEEGKSLGDVLQILYDSVDGNAEQFANLWGNVRAGRGALTLAQQGAEGFNQQLARMENATGNVEEALEKLNTPSTQLKKALNQLKNTGIELGTTLLDILQPAFDKTTQFAKELSKWWRELSPDTQDLIVKAGLLAVALGPIITGIGTLTTGLGGLLTKIPTVAGGFSSLFSLVAAHPFAALGIAAATAIGGIAVALSNTKDAMGPATKAALEFKEANDETIATITAQNERMEVLNERIKELNEQEELSATEKQMLAQYVEELNGLLGEEAVHIDTATGKTIENTEEIYKNIEARQAAALAAAYEDAIAEAAKRAAESQIALLDAEANLNINTRELADAQDRLATATADAKKRLDNMTEAEKLLINTDTYVTEATKNERQAVKDLEAEREALQLAIEDNTTAYAEHIQEMTRMDNASQISQGALDNLLKKVGKTASDLSPTLERGLRDGTYKIPKTVAELNQLIAFDKAAQRMGPEGQEIVKKLQQGMLEGKVSVSSAAGQLASAAKQGISGASSSAESVGREISNGLIRGMNSKSWEVASAAGAIAGTAIKRMKSVAQVSSPSKLTEYIGAMYDAGLGRGMLNNIRKYITPAVDEVMNAVDLSGIDASFDASGATIGTPNMIAGLTTPKQPTLDPAEIYAAVREGASAATIRSFISGREVTSAVNQENTNILNAALNFRGVF